MDYWVQDKLKSLESAFTKEYCQAIDKVASLIVKSFQQGNTLLICGNGGSASDAQHIAAEFIGRFLINRKGLPAIALSTNPATLTAWTNDNEFETIFSRQVESLGKPGDILWGISTSGKSQNVVKALKIAKQLGIITIGMAGNNGGILKEISDYSLFVSEHHTPLVQEIHVITYHRICEQVELKLFTKLT
ncbi:phosphoheptose isomerase [Nostoc sp. CENA543]|uniref:D-sedoheptulose 7-phosphate isomerase n=1 Tax=Nostoc sp. CENA543 TaxID=1869241 RepID=UPI000CA246DE|nr:D-sedoheptulose 7-phosphate isomerase [Nostoc sp. CENA543]AUS99240.1 phosphoheptose isomerase [Nostoc sp. CENA543]